MKILDIKKVCKKCNSPSFKSAGIMSLCEHEKNAKNPDDGDTISFISSSEATNNIKEALAGLMNVEGNKKLIKLIEECNDKYPKVKSLLEGIMDF